MSNNLKTRLIEQIRTKRGKVAVAGLGYVGLPLAVEFAKSGFTVAAIDVDSSRVEQLNRGQSYIPDISSEEIRAIPAGHLRAVTDYSVLSSCSAVLICVPTPLSKTRDPDMSYLVDCCEAIAEYCHSGMLVCLESTTYPGTTAELVRPIMERSGLRAGQDLFLSFSPERIDPGRVDFRLANTPKVVGGVTPACLEVAVELYQTIIQTVVPVSSTEAAEMVKLLENTFRAVNIALVNETSIICDKLGLDAWEVVEAAATKPYGFMKFTPGPGVGGHCIPLDPHYLSWKLKTLNYNARFIQLAGEINGEMPRIWANKVQDRLNSAGKPLKGSRVLLLGVAYKKDVTDVRESPALDIIELLHCKGTDVRYYDPYVPEIRHNGVYFKSETDLIGPLKSADCVVIVTDHSCFDWSEIEKNSELLVDTRNVVKRHHSALDSRAGRMEVLPATSNQ